MSFFEMMANRIRRIPILKNLLRCIRDLFRPVYELVLKVLFPKGLLRTVDGLGRVYICHESRLHYVVPGDYEIPWWERLLQEVREGDVIADIGAYVGLFSILLAKRTGNTGKVFVFEPNIFNFNLLKRNIGLNEVSERIEAYNMAISDREQEVALVNKGPLSQVFFSVASSDSPLTKVKAQSLDTLFGNSRLDILKIDIEGYEPYVIKGATNLLKRKTGYPRFIFIECHPYAWKEFGINGNDSLITPLQEAGYKIDMSVLPDNIKLDDYRYPFPIFASRHTS